MKGKRPLNARLWVTAALLAAVLPAVSCGTNSPSGVGKDELLGGKVRHILPDTRRVELTCEVTVQDVPEGTKEVRLWIPFPAGGPYQRVLEPMIQSPASYRPIIRYEERYGTPVVYVSAEAPLPQDFRVEYTLGVERLKIDDRGAKAGPPEPENELSPRFAPEFSAGAGMGEAELQGIVAGMSPADNSMLARARAVYHYVIDTLEPDNAPTALSQRPLAEVLASRAGNSADYAALTLALMQAAGIPARIESGVRLVEQRTPDRTGVPDRAAWVRFYVGDAGWSACDPFLADRSPELKDRLFAALDANRVQLAAGPEPGIVPKPDQPVPVVFAEAFAEADGKPLAVQTRIFFRDGGTLP